MKAKVVSRNNINAGLPFYVANRLLFYADQFNNFKENRTKIPLTLKKMFSDLNLVITRLENEFYTNIVVYDIIKMSIPKYRLFFDDVLKNKLSEKQQLKSLEMMDLAWPLALKQKGDTSLLLLSKKDILDFIKPSQDHHTRDKTKIAFEKLTNYYFNENKEFKITYSSFEKIQRNKTYKYNPTPLDSSLSPLKKLVKEFYLHYFTEGEIKTIINIFENAEARYDKKSKLEMGKWMSLKS